MHERTGAMVGIGLRTGRASPLGWALLGAALLAVGCVTPAEFRKVERRVIDLERGGGGAAPSDRARLAELAAQIESLEHAIDQLEGRIEVTEHRTQEALEEARAARGAASALPQGTAASAPDAATAPDVPDSDEVKQYRASYAKWRAGDSQACIDQFTKFLQTYPASDYADDATYWLGDCYFKQGNFSAAVLRFDDVARQYPGGNKAADALYRQGEALLRMGHGKAAGNAFEKVIREYPDSARAPEAKRQLDLLGSG